MKIFVVAKKNSEFLDTPVLTVGEQDGQESIMLFTTRELAAKYIEDAGWQDAYEAGELLSIQLVRWLAVACEQGTEMVSVNPVRDEHLADVPQRVVFLDEPFGAFAELLRSAIIERADAGAVGRTI